jgi:hypothetical protein
MVLHIITEGNGKKKKEKRNESYGKPIPSDL